MRKCPIFDPFNPFFSAIPWRVMATLESKRSHLAPCWTLGDMAVAPPKRKRQSRGHPTDSDPGSGYQPMHRRSRIFSGVAFTIAIHDWTASRMAATECKKTLSMAGDRLSQPRKALMRFYRFYAVWHWYDPFRLPRQPWPTNRREQQRRALQRHVRIDPHRSLATTNPTATELRTNPAHPKAKYPLTATNRGIPRFPVTLPN